MEGRRRKTRLKPSSPLSTLPLFTSLSSPSSHRLLSPLISSTLSQQQPHSPTLSPSSSSSSTSSATIFSHNNFQLPTAITDSSTHLSSITESFLSKFSLKLWSNFHHHHHHHQQQQQQKQDNHYLITKKSNNNNNNNSALLLFQSSPIFLFLFIIIIINTFIPFLCYAQESDFALRPFSASLQHHHPHHQANSRRQDGFLSSMNDGIHPIVRHHPHHSTLTSTSISGVSSLHDEQDFGMLTAPVPRGSSSNPRPSFQRIRLTNPNSAQSQKPPPQPLSSLSFSMPQHTSRQIQSPKQSFVLPDEFVPVTLNESPAPNFHRLVGLPPASSRISLQPQPVPIPSQIPRQSFRRIKPPTNGNWRSTKPKIPTIQPTAIAVEPSQVRPNAGRLPLSSNIAIITANDKLIGRGPITGAQDDDLSHKPNALDNEEDSGIGIDRDRSSSFYGNRVSPSDTNDDNGILVIESLSRSSNIFEPVRTRSNVGPQSTAIPPNVVPTPTIPLTYYTTFTYYTTVVRGPHTAMLSREQVSSSTQLKPIDRNIVTAIEFSDGYIQSTPTKVLLGTKTKGATTTIYNVASRVQVFNDDLYKVIFATNSKMIPRPSTVVTNVASSSVPVSSSHRISPTRVQITPILLESTKVMTRHPPAQHNNEKPVTVRLEQLQKQLKKQLSLLTYYYTLIDGTQTQYSTRVEESSTNYNGDLQTLLPSMAPTIDSYGLLKIIQPNSIVPLGSRANGGSTTIVNLALNNYIQFSRIKDAQIDIAPTSSLSPTSHIQPTRLSTISSSMEPEEPETFRETAKLGSTNIYLDTSTPTPSLLSTPTIIEPSEPITMTSSRSRTSSPRRPGVRIKLKPSRSKIVNQISRSSIETSEQSSIRNVQDSTSYVLTPTVIDQTPVLNTMDPNEDSLTPSSRKKVAFTLRRPGSSGGNRFFSRRPSTNLFNSPSSSVLSSLDITASRPSSVIESTMTTSSISSSEVSSTPSLPNQIDSSSLNSWSVIFGQPSPSPSPIWEPSSTLIPTPTSRINKSRLVVLTRLAGGVNKWSPMYNNRIRVSSRRLIKSTQPLTSMIIDSSSMEPSSSHETLVYETSTHTVPINLRPTSTFIMGQGANTRVVDSKTPSIKDITRIIPGEKDSISEKSTQSSLAVNSEQAKTYVVVETSDILTTSTLYSTYTYFATLFNGTQTSITPLEEIKTEYLTLREPIVITKTIMPSAQFTPTNAFQSSQTPSASTISIDSSIDSSDDHNVDDMTRLITETYSTQTTLTHFITLFSGSHTILSSIEEISPTVMTRTKYVTPYTLLTSSVNSQINVMIDSSKIMSTTSSSQQYNLPSSTGYYDDTTTTTTSNDLMITDSLPTDKSSPSPPLTTPGSISYETGPLDQDFIMVNQDYKKPMPNRTLSNQQQSTTTTAVLEPGSVIELEDLLDGVHDAGPIGETIKDIVKDIFIKDGDDDTSTTTTLPSSINNGQPDTTISPSSSSTTKATPSLNRYPMYLSPPSQKSSKYYDSSRDNDAIFSTQSDGDKSTVSTRYVTSIEKSIRTLTLTSTKVYYTRDSPLTITSVLTTTLPPITYVSTIIGSKTILGTYNSITPTKTTIMDSSTTSTAQIVSSMPSIIASTPSSSTTVSSTASPTRPRLHRPKLANDMVNRAKVASILTGGKTSTMKPTIHNGNQQQPNLVRNNHTNITIAVDHLQLCDPACNVTNKEYCRENDIPNLYTCECRPGYVRRPSDNLCQEIKNYLVTVRVSKTAESEVAATSTTSDGELQKYARVARRQVGKADGIAGLQVLSVEHTTRSRGALVNLTIQINHQSNNVHDELSKKLEPLGRVEKVIDFDECSSPIHNDCSPRAHCINEPGSYSCQCLEPFIDLDRSLPGRLCVTEIKSCDYCYGRGDCWRNNSDTVCRCHPMFIGRRCEINGLLLAILVPIVAILVIIAIICFFYCSRKLRQRNRRFKNLAAYGPVAVIGGTLDRKAMLETSSESSDPQQQQQHHHRSSQYMSESNPASARGSMARRGNQTTTSTLRRESEPSLDRSLASYSATGSHYNSLPHQIVIPRARPTYALHPGQVYMW